MSYCYKVIRPFKDNSPKKNTFNVVISFLIEGYEPQMNYNKCMTGASTAGSIFLGLGDDELRNHLKQKLEGHSWAEKQSGCWGAAKEVEE